MNNGTNNRWEPLLGNTQQFNSNQSTWMHEYVQAHRTDNFQNFAGGDYTIDPNQVEIPATKWGNVALPIVRRVAAQTIGLDLVSVKPMSSPRIELMFLDFKYDSEIKQEYDPLNRDEEDQNYEPWDEE